MSCRWYLKIAAISCIHDSCRIRDHGCLTLSPFYLDIAFITHVHHELILLLRSMVFFDQQDIFNIIVPPKK
jgi:hypothetical protein